MSLPYNFIVSVLRKMNIYDKRDLSYSLMISSMITEGDKTILDIGTGTGYMADTLSKKGKRFVVGLDIDKTRFNRNSCIEHLSRPLTAISEISRTAKQNGLCITQLPNFCP